MGIRHTLFKIEDKIKGNEHSINWVNSILPGIQDEEDLSNNLKTALLILNEKKCIFTICETTLKVLSHLI